jgi:hypothetical protein
MFFLFFIDMMLSYDIIGEILLFSDSLNTHMNVRMLCKKLRSWLRDERSRYYSDITFTVTRNIKKKPYWVINLNLSDYVYDKELIFLEGIKRITFKGIKYLSHCDGTKITDNGLVHLNGIEYLELLCNQNITDEGFVHLKGIKYLILIYNHLISDKGLICLKNIHTLCLDGHNKKRTLD